MAGPAVVDVQFRFGDLYCLCGAIRVRQASSLSSAQVCAARLCADPSQSRGGRDAVARAARDMHGRLVALRERPLVAVRIDRDDGESADKLAAAPEFSDGWVVQSRCVGSSSDAA
jgi:hypothetical protein